MPRQPSGIQRHVVGAIVSVAASAAHMGDLHLFRRQAQSERQITPQSKHTLAMAPDLQTLWRPMRQGAARPHRGVMQVGAKVVGAERRVAGARFSGRTAFVKHLGLSGLFFPCALAVHQIQAMGLGLPLQIAVQDLRGRFCPGLGRCDHTHQLTVAHQLQRCGPSGTRPHLARGKLHRHLRPHRFIQLRTQLAWSQHAAMQQAFGLQVVNEVGMAVNDPAQIFAPRILFQVNGQCGQIPLHRLVHVDQAR